MKKIILTKGLFAIVDDEDFDYLNQWKWYAQGGNKKYRAARRRNRREIVYMHRLVMEAPENLHVDHINGDQLNNQKSNLRLVTKHQNGANRHVATSNSGYKGVSKLSGWRYFKKPFQVHIVVGGKRIHIGYFSTVEEAAKAYDREATKHFGEYACLNFKST